MDRILSLLPSKKFAATIGASVLVVGLVVGAYYLAPTLQKKPVQATSQDNAQLIASRALMEAAAEKDSDGDGLKDWEEALWHSDPHNRDSDGDGTEDSAEVEEGRDPTKRGPNDKVDKTKSPGIVSETDHASSTYSLTDAVAKDLFATYMNAKATGQALDPDSQSQLISSVMSRHRLPSAAKQYTNTDIKTVPSTNESIRKYENDLAATLLRYPASETELSVLSRALQTNSEEELKKLAPIAESYDKTLHDLLLLPVPEELAQYHLNLINENSVLLQNTVEFEKVFSDPVTSLMGLGASKTIAADIKANLTKIADAARKRNFIFTENEPAYTLLKYMQ